MTLANKTVLVTGATGFIGSHLVQRLIAEGARVRAFAHYRSDPTLHNLEYLTPEERNDVDVIRGAIEDETFVRTAVDGCDVVFHLAALIGIPYSYAAPTSYVNVNIRGTLNILESARQLGVRRVVHTSTSECYGTALHSPMDEQHPLQAQSPYAATKIAADKLAESYYRSFDLPVITVRPFNTFGPRQSERAITPTIVAQLLSGAAELRLGSVEPVRDLTFVGDTVDGFVRAAEASGGEGEVVNLGTGTGVTIGELAERIMTILDYRVPVREDAARLRPEKSEVRHLLSDNSKARDLLGWRPATSLDDGLHRTIQFMRENPHRYRGSLYEI